MRGRLSEQPVPDVCRALSGDGVTGALEVSGGPGVGRVFFREGSVYWAMSPAPRAQLGARLVNAGFISRDQLDATLHEQSEAEQRTKLGALLVEKGLVTHDVIRVFVQEQILDALFDLMRWRDGDFVFNPGDAVDEKLPIDVPVARLLVEASRRQNEWDQIQRIITSLDAVPDHVVGGNAATTALEQDEFTMLASIDGNRSVKELAADLGYSEFEAARIVYGLTLLGIVDVEADAEAEVATEPEAEVRAEPEPPAPPPSPPAPEDDELDVGAALEQALFGRDELGPAPKEETADDDLQVTVHFDLDQQRQPPPRQPRTEAPEPIPDDWLDTTEPQRPAAAEARPAAQPSEWASGDDEGPEPWVMTYGQDQAGAAPEVEDREPPAVREPEPTEPEPVAPEPAAAADPLAELASVAEELEQIDEFAELEGLEELEGAGEPGEDQPAEPEPGDVSTAELAAQFADLSSGPEPTAEPAVEPSTAEEPAAREPEAEEPAAQEPEAEEPAARDAADEPAADEPEDGFFAGRPSEPAEPAGDAERPRSGDVSEFLRELSRLSLDEEEGEGDEADEAGAPRRFAPPPPEDKSGDDRKKRGRFGWGR